jgi:hypothetical protein
MAIAQSDCRPTRSSQKNRRTFLLLSKIRENMNMLFSKRRYRCVDNLLRRCLHQVNFDCSFGILFLTSIRLLYCFHNLRFNTSELRCICNNQRLFNDVDRPKIRYTINLSKDQRRATNSKQHHQHENQKSHFHFPVKVKRHRSAGRGKRQVFQNPRDPQLRV